MAGFSLDESSQLSAEVVGVFVLRGQDVADLGEY